MTGFLRHVTVDPADHPDTLPSPDALGGMFEAAGSPSPERRLAGAVLGQALRDALTLPSHRSAFDRREARDWLDAGGPHFTLVCDLAGLHPARVAAHWRRVRDTPLHPGALRALRREFDR